MSQAYPVLYRVSLQTREATGDVLFYCCEYCRDAEHMAMESTCHDLFFVKGHDDGAIPGTLCEFCDRAIEEGVGEE